MLQNWNFGLQILSPAVLHPNQARPLVLYGSAWAEGDRLPCPRRTFLPAFRSGCTKTTVGRSERKDDLAKRRNITITVSKGVIS